MNDKIKDIILISFDNHLTLMHYNYGGYGYTIESCNYKFEYDFVNNRLYLRVYDNDSYRIPLSRNNLQLHYTSHNGDFNELDLIIDSKGCHLKKTSKR